MPNHAHLRKNNSFCLWSFIQFDINISKIKKMRTYVHRDLCENIHDSICAVFSHKLRLMASVKGISLKVQTMQVPISVMLDNRNVIDWAVSEK